MLGVNDIIAFSLTESEVKNCLEKAIKNLSISKRDNLRNRHPNIQLDCMLRGYIGEYAFSKWLKQYNLYFEATNHRLIGDSVDIDFIYKGLNIELKTSLIPDADVNIETAVLKRDIKLIKREENIEDFRGDIHVQIFFAQRRKAKDTWLKNLSINLNNNNLDYLYDTLLAKAYLQSTYLIAWIDRQSLIEKISQMQAHEREWSFKGSMRKFWNCKITESRKPLDLAKYLKYI